MSARPITRWCIEERFVPGKWVLNPTFIGPHRALLMEQYLNTADGFPPEYRAVKVRITPVITAGYKP